MLSAVDLLARYLTQGNTLSRARGGLWKRVFLAALEAAPIVSVACRIARISRKGAYQARATDREFAAAWDEAIEAGVDAVEASAFKSAVYGDERPVFHQGVCVGTIVEYSDAMRALLLKGRRRAVYGEKVETHHSGKVGMTLEEFEQRVKDARA